MSRIFSHYALREGLLPTEEGFAIVPHLMERLAQHPSIFGGAVFGSVATDTATAQSDADVLILAPDDPAGLEDALNQVRLCQQDLAQHWRVPLNAVIVSRTALSRPPHALRRGLCEHVRSRGRPFGEIDPRPLIALPATSVAGDALEYANVKLERLCRDALDEPSFDHDQLASVFDAPVQLARKFVHAKTGREPGGKAEVRRRFAAFVDQTKSTNNLTAALGCLEEVAQAERAYIDAVLAGPFERQPGFGRRFRASESYEVFLRALWQRAARPCRSFLAHVRSELLSSTDV